MPDVPPHIEISLDEPDARDLLEATPARFVRWSTDFDMKEKTTFWHVIKDGWCSLEELSKNTRNQVRKGLKNCTVNLLSPESLARSGYRVYTRALTSYNTDLKIMTEQEFFDTTMELAEDDSIEFWGVRDHQENLIAYAQNRIQDGCCNYQVIKLDPAHRSMYPGYALVFEMNRHYLNEREMAYVNDGARSIRHDTRVQDFLIQKFKFRKAYSRLHVVYRRNIQFAVKALYPLRSIIGKVPGALFVKAGALLRQEEIRRSFD